MRPLGSTWNSQEGEGVGVKPGQGRGEGGVYARLASWRNTDGAARNPGEGWWWRIWSWVLFWMVCSFLGSRQQDGIENQARLHNMGEWVCGGAGGDGLAWGMGEMGGWGWRGGGWAGVGGRQRAR